MKCDELINYPMTRITADFLNCKRSANTLYNEKAEVDAAIAELKDENKLLKEHIANGDVSRITWIDEVIELKQKLHDAEMRADLAEAAETEHKIDYDNLKKEHRQTLRALWIARADRNELMSRDVELDNYTYDLMTRGKRSHYEYYEDAGKYEEWTCKLEKASKLCRSKADTFKEDENV